MTYKILPDYPGYMIYENGDIFSFSTKRGWLKPGLTKDGYKQVNVKSKLAKNGYRHSMWQVKAIRFFYEYYSYKQTQLAEIYGITQTQVSSIILRKSWAHV